MKIFSHLDDSRNVVIHFGEAYLLSIIVNLSSPMNAAMRMRTAINNIAHDSIPHRLVQEIARSQGYFWRINCVLNA